MTKEDKYIQELKELGIWQPAFAGAVHDLAVLEREQARARKAWKATAEEGEAPSLLNPLYSLIRKQGQEITAMRDALGLTPKGLRRLRGAVGQEEPEKEETATVLSLVRGKFA